jgi:hypothetical protein
VFMPQMDGPLINRINPLLSSVAGAKACTTTSSFLLVEMKNHELFALAGLSPPK